MNSNENLSHSERRAAVHDLFEPRALVYWLDFSVSAALGWGAFYTAVVASGWALMLAGIIVSALCLYRAVLFTHELVHLGPSRVRGFRLFWNLCCGIPLLVPSFFYDGVHQEHHFRRQYGTETDGEYLPFGSPPRARILLYLVSHLFLPPLMVARFGILGPLSWLSRSARRLVWRRMSSLSIDPRYERQVPVEIPRNWIIQELCCSVYVWLITLLLFFGALTLHVITILYVVSVMILLFNGVRTLAAHRYAGDGSPMTFDQQLMDSVNIVGGWATPILAPVGLRYHGLHHLFPTMPYHNLAAAHVRLTAQFPHDAAYSATLVGSMSSALRQIWRAAGSGSFKTSTRPA